MRKIIFEMPVGIEISEEELAKLQEKFRSMVIDTKSEHLMVQARGLTKEKAQLQPVIVQAQEVAQEVQQEKTA
jgi:hypothetical protein